MILRALGPNTSGSDIILVGETRDKETVKLQWAQLTGHIVFNLHANDTATAIADF